jgi:hypothetical protein
MPCCSGSSGSTSAGPPGIVASSSSTSSSVIGTSGKSEGVCPVRSAERATARSASSHSEASCSTSARDMIPVGQVSIAENSGPAAVSWAIAFTDRARTSELGSTPSPSAS